MLLWEVIIVSIGIALNVFAVMICWGAMLPVIRKKWLMVTSLIFGTLQGLAMLIGRALILLPFIQDTSGKITHLERGLTFVTFAGLGLYMFFKAHRVEMLVERRKETYGWKEALLLAWFTSFDAFLVGMSMGFLDTRILPAIGCFLVVTVIAAVAGTYTGYWFGCEKRGLAYQVGGVFFMLSGIDILVNYLI